MSRSAVRQIQLNGDFAKLGQRLVGYHEADADQPCRKHFQSPIADCFAVPVQQAVIHTDGPAFDLPQCVGSGQRRKFRGLVGGECRHDEK